MYQQSENNARLWNVISLFDGISCGQVALVRAGIKYKNYYASETDIHAIRITMKNFPKTRQLGDVCHVKGKRFPKIDLLIGGSPCQGFSFAGKGLNFNDPRSRLFFEFVRVLKELRKKNPKIKFLLENVQMKKEFQDVISKALGVEPVMINSALVSAQNRKRLYWTNIKGVTQPQDKNIHLKDILEPVVKSKYFLSPRQLNKLERSSDQKKHFSKINPEKGLTMTSRQYTNWKGTFIKTDIKGMTKTNQNKASCLTGGGHSGGNHSDMDFIVQSGRIVGRNPENPKSRKKGLPTKQMLEERLDNKAGCLTLAQKDSIVIERSTLSNTVRRLTPIECERLQTLPDNYTAGASDSQRYKTLGNGWTVDVITHILKNINK